MRLALLATAAALVAAAAPASAQPAGPGEPRVNQLIVYGNDPCPRGSNDEIIVCARKPESERYRIPENLRGDPTAPHNEAWANRAEDLEYVGRTGIGSCGPVGPGGFTGCLAQLIRQARAERQNSDEVNWNRLIDEARQKRLDQIDAQSAVIEERVRAEEQQQQQSPPP